MYGKTGLPILSLAVFSMFLLFGEFCDAPFVKFTWRLTAILETVLVC